MVITSAKQLAVFIRDYRKQHNISQSKISSLVGVRQSTVSAFENTPGITKLDTLFRILAATKLEIKINPRGGEKKSKRKDEW